MIESAFPRREYPAASPFLAQRLITRHKGFGPALLPRRSRNNPSSLATVDHSRPVVARIDGTPPLVARLLNRYVDRVLTASEYDTVAIDQFSRVISLIDPATRLLRPAIMWRAALANYRKPPNGIDQPGPAADVLADSVPR